MTRRSVVLAYHAVAPCEPADDPEGLFVDPATFANQMAYLAETGRVASLQVATKDPRGGHIAVTFDDAYCNLLTFAVPALERHRIPATVFVPTGHLGTTNSWMPPSRCDLTIMDEGQLEAALASGLDLQSHGHGHIDYSKASPESARSDLTASIEALERITQKRPRYLAYPWGRFNRASAQAVAEAGIEGAFSIYVPAEDRDRPRVPPHLAADRVPVTGYDGMRVFRAKLSGRYLALRRNPLIGAAYGFARPIVRRVLERTR